MKKTKLDREKSDLPRGYKFLADIEVWIQQAQQAQQPVKKGSTQKEDERITSSLRYRKSYMENLDLLYLNEKIKRRKVTKADLVEEALDLLFEKYNM